MFIAHLPAGYLLGRALHHKLSIAHFPKSQYWLLLAALIGSVLPDLDLFYFYLIDNRQHNHHTYWMHWPVFWLGIFAAGMAVAAVCKNAVLARATLMLCLGVFLHLLLDTLTGGIAWLAPWYQHYFGLIDVPARYGWWVWNYILHWSFTAEIIIVLLAIYKAFTDYINRPHIMYQRPY